MTDSERAEIRELATAKVEAIRDRQALAVFADSEDRDAVTTDDAESRELRSLQERATTWPRRSPATRSMAQFANTDRR
ncbi:MAG: hypothetical protein OXD29_08765 [Roseovarius sp.]|nr:hypothetical protein [Roseovarius sp.]